jgi:pimeloyl-ACP methyl ester carboxylesterase
MTAWAQAGRAAWAWLAAREEIDPTRIGLLGNSFGSFFATVAAGAESRYRAVAVSAICLEPHGETIFQKASPTFKHRFMYMSGMTDEARFDRMRRSMVLAPSAARIRAPYLCVAGERDELCPIEWADRLMTQLRGVASLGGCRALDRARAAPRDAGGRLDARSPARVADGGRTLVGRVERQRDEGGTLRGVRSPPRAPGRGRSPTRPPGAPG